MTFNWNCPFCNHKVTITDQKYVETSSQFNNENKHGLQTLKTQVTICPNPDCQEYSVKVQLLNGGLNAALKMKWQLIPPAEMKVFPSYVPDPIVADYKEACLIRDLSPKASATLSRRCLQGMIRDFWGIKKVRLIDEIEAIEANVDPLTWSAIDAVRKIGNIGAHMEKDINLVIDVDPQEASLLIGLIEMLIKDWYITKHEREQRLNEIIAAAGNKEVAKNGAISSPTN